MKVLYIRTSTIEQNSERQKQNTEGNCKIIEDKCSGAVPFFERQGGKKILELTMSKCGALVKIIFLCLIIKQY